MDPWLGAEVPRRPSPETFRGGVQEQGPTPSTRETAFRLRTIGFPVPQRLAPLRLATTPNSPARDSRRNPQRCSAGLAVSLAMTASTGFRAFTLRGNLPTCFMLFSQASRPTFHLSLKLLVRYRTPDVFRLGRSALPFSAGNSGPTYSFSGCHRVFAYGAVALFGCLFQGNSAGHVEALPAPHVDPVSGTDSARPLPVSLAATSGIAFAFSSCPYHDASPQGVPAPGPVGRRVTCFPGGAGSESDGIGGQGTGAPGLTPGTKSHSEIPGS